MIRRAALVLLVLTAGASAPGCRMSDSRPPDSEPRPPLSDTTLAARRQQGASLTTSPLSLALPDIALPTLNTDSLRLSAFQGRTVLLNYWATWCPPCRTQIASLSQIHSEWQDRDVVILGITEQPDSGKVHAFTEAYGIPYPVAFDDGRLAGILGGVYSLPTTFIVSPEGRVTQRVTGVLSPGDLALHLQFSTPAAP